jgi:hypothetical protein
MATSALPNHAIEHEESKSYPPTSEIVSATLKALAGAVLLFLVLLALMWR